MKKRLRICAHPNGDLAFDRQRRVWKLKPDGWTQIDYLLPTTSIWIERPPMTNC